MPFTPFHLGMSLGLGLPFRRYIHVPTFLLTSIIVDVEPILVLLLGLRYPLHGYLHTFFCAVPVGLLFGYVSFFLEGFFQPLYRLFLLETDINLSLRSFLVTGGLGTGLHVLLDSPLYREIQPFFPLDINPVYTPSVTSEIYNVCIGLGIFGLTYYLGLIINSICKR